MRISKARDIPMRVRVVILLFFESLPEIDVKIGLSSTFAMILWFFKRFVFGLLFLRNVLLFGIFRIV